MKRNILFVVVLIWCLRPAAQKIGNSYSSGHVGSTTAPLIETGHYSDGLLIFEKWKFEDLQLKQMVDQRMKDNNLYFKQIFDTASAYFYVKNIRAEEAKNFEYQVLEYGKRTIIPWTTLEVNPATSTAYLGAYKAGRGNYILVNLKKKGASSDTYSSLVQWPFAKPRVTNIFLADEMNLLLNRIAPYSLPKADTANLNRWKRRYPANQIDTISGLPINPALEPDENNMVFYLNANIQKAEELEYELLRDGKVFRKWGKNNFDHPFVWLTNLEPGKYELKMRYRAQPDQVTSYPFSIKPRWDQTLSFKIIAGGLVAAFFGLMVMVPYSRNQKRKLKMARMKKQQVEAELKSLHAQLNPHFVFNALSSIQGLVNKNETEKANHYLSSFSRLLRDSLLNGEKSKVPLATEIQTLETYLQLEQLRFQFEYSIYVDEGINTASVELPSLLLQPLVENAIKHGVAGLHRDGRIEIYFKKQDQDMSVTIQDNGIGFDPSIEANGFGLKLTRQRIELLNEDKDHHVHMEIHTTSGNTTIALTFKNALV
ncbi:MAG: sensor histidine kinase [Flavisolibacter sp.]